MSGEAQKVSGYLREFCPELWMPGVVQWARVASGQRGSDGRLSGLGRGNPDQTGSQTGERNHSFLERVIWFSSTDDIRDLNSLVCSCDYYQTRPPLCPRSPVTSGQCWPDLVTGASLALVPRSPSVPRHHINHSDRSDQNISPIVSHSPLSLSTIGVN